ncbi:MAG: ABC transporter ATP-binding protein [Myxococcota bacterium]
MTLVVLKDVERTYTLKGEVVHALAGVDLEIEGGAFMALAGPSGSGKTTLLNVIGALDSPTGGTAEVDGSRLDAMSASELSELRRDRLGFIFQSYNLIPVLTVLENVEYVMMLQGWSVAKRRARAKEVLEELGLVSMLERKPLELSGGQQQRVAVARAIASRPSLVLADEPTANLDSQTGEELIRTMQRLNADHGMTFVFATHDPMVMAEAQRLVRVRDGKIVDDEIRAPSRRAQSASE